LFSSLSLLGCPDSGCIVPVTEALRRISVSWSLGVILGYFGVL